MKDHRFKSYDPDQLLLLPPDMKDWLPENHLAWFVSDVVDQLDLSDIIREYGHLKGGRPGFHPLMMIKLLFYAYCVGVPSSRQIEKKTYEDVAFRVLAAGYHPDHSAIAKFRKRHMDDLRITFIEVLILAEQMGLVKMGHVALDGTKIKANASKHKAMSYGRMDQRIRELKAEVDALMARAQSTDEAEDKKYGKDKRGDELPSELAFKQSRIEKIQAAKAELEMRKQQESGRPENDDHDDPSGGSAASDAVPVKPDPKTQYNFTDPESRIMPDNASKSFEQAYNAQIAVDCDSQIILACGVCQSTNDKHQFIPLFEEIEANTGQIPDKTLADAGYYTAENVAFAARNWTEPLIAWKRTKHSEKPPDSPRGRIPHGAGPVERMRRRLQTLTGRRAYAKRKQSVEPAIGQIKEIRGFRRFLLRGLSNVQAEWSLICLTHNILKLWKSGRGLHSPA
jgi:transposase